MATLAIFSCSKSDDNKEITTNPLNVKNKELSLKAGETKNVEATSGSKITYSFPQDELRASVSQNGDVKGFFVGETVLTVSDQSSTQNVKVSIVPEYNLFYEPLLKFNSSKEEVKNYMKKGNFEETKDGMYTYSFGDSRDLNEFYKMGYSFEGNKLKSVILAFAFNSKYKLDVMKYLGERYIPITSTAPNTFVFTNPEKGNEFFIGFSFDALKNVCTIFYSKLKDENHNDFNNQDNSNNNQGNQNGQNGQNNDQQGQNNQQNNQNSNELDKREALIYFSLAKTSLSNRLNKNKEFEFWKNTLKALAISKGNEDVYKEVEDFLKNNRFATPRWYDYQQEEINKLIDNLKSQESIINRYEKIKEYIDDFNRWR